MYAVIETGGKQYRVKTGDLIEVEKLNADKGTSVTLDKILMIGEGEKVIIGTPTVKGATVVVEIADHYRGEKVIAFKYRRRKQSCRTRGHRQAITKIEVKAINA